ncbi:MAG: SsrA-binding protein SmpB [Methylococcales bacterium]|nr:SsrA-binding protein SmpB [Methylococcales bacterium]
MATKKSKKKNKSADNNIAVNRHARHDYFVEERFEAGLVLQGWEVKSLRDGRIQLKESYVLLKRGEAWLFGAHVSPLLSASTHVVPNNIRSKKLLLHKRELSRLIGAVERKGYTIIPLSMYWVKGRAKLEIGLAKGKQLHDKRATSKDRDWQREKARIMKHA